MKRKTLVKTAIGLVLASIFLLIIVKSQLTQQRWRCEVCMNYNNQRSCSIARGPSEEEAYRSAADTACALIASGVTERMACPRQKPSSQKCESLAEM